MQQMISKDLSTLERALEWAYAYFKRRPLFFGHGTDNAWDEAVFLMSHCVGRAELFVEDQRMLLTEAQQTQFSTLCDARVRKRIPAAYLVGHMYFSGLCFEVNATVLVPRSPIAELILENFKPWVSAINTVDRVLDLCTGSGCIGIAIAHYHPNVRVTLSDISEEALQIVRKNAQLHALAQRIELLQSDLFTAIEGSYDLIVSNPPYVSEANWHALPEEYHHEPKLALVARKGGLALVEKILLLAGSYLTDQGMLIVEVGALAPRLVSKYPELSWIDLNLAVAVFFVLMRARLKK